MADDEIRVRISADTSEIASGALAAADALSVVSAAASSLDNTAKVASGSVAGLEKSLGAVEAKLANFDLSRIASASQAARVTGEQQLAVARERISEINADETLGGQERLAAVRQVWQETLDGEKLTGIQRLSVERAMNAALATANREAANEQRAVARSKADADLEIARIGFDKKRYLLDQEVAAHRMARADELHALVSLAEAEGEAQRGTLAAAEQTYARDSAEFVAAENRKRIVAAQTAAEIAKLNSQIAAANERTLADEVQSWSTAKSEILRTEDTLVQGIMGGRETLGLALDKAAWGFAEREIEADLHAMTMRVLFSKEELSAKQASEQGGLLFHLFSEQQQTAATATGVAQRVSAEQAASASGTAVQAALGRSAILNDAKEAAAGAYAATAQIPVVGPILAPAAAAVAFTAVAAFDTLTSAEGGAWDVAGGLFQLHPRESVLPADVATPMRSFFEDGGASAGTSDSFHITINAIDAAGVQRLFRQNGAALVAALAAQKRDLGSFLGQATRG